jgi:hypothetical protein
MSPRASALPAPTAFKAMSAVVGVLALGVLFQGITAGIFLPGVSKTGAINAHKGVGDLLVLLALATVVMAFTMWRGKAGFQVVSGEAIALLVLCVVELGVGQAMAKNFGKHHGLLVIHIPVALLIFAITTHLSTYLANLRRSGA